MNRLLFLAERAFTIASFIHFSGGILLLILSGGISEGEEGDDLVSYALINLLFSIIYIISFALLMLRWKKVLPAIFKGGLIWLLIGLAVFSIFWSYSPELTRTRVIALIGTAIFSIYFASRYSLKEQLELIGWTFVIIIFTSIYFSVLLPKYGQMGGVHLGAWRGIYSHKNAFGKMMALSIVVFSLLALQSQKSQWIWSSLIGIAAWLMLLSRASSPLVNLAILMSILFVLHILRWNYMLMIPALIGVSSIGIIGYSLVISNAEQIAGTFGKNMTLTGRTNFWPLMLDKIWESPWLGYGFGAFWQGLDGPSAYVWNASAFKAPNGHNGYLDLCLDLGFVGLFIYILKFTLSFQKALTYIRITRTPDGFWPVLFLCNTILANLTESSLMLQNNFLWVIQISTFLSLYLPQPNIKKSLISEKIQ